MHKTDLRCADFYRRWDLTRDVQDRLAQTTCRFTGQAWIAPGAYVEKGTLQTPAGRFEASRRYLWHPGDGGFEICFDDGRPFHRLIFADPTDHHHCAPDDYAVRYDLSAFPHWSCAWDVRGPRKNYHMQSWYH